MLVEQKPRNVIEEFLRNFTSYATIMAYRKDIESFFRHFNGKFTHPADISFDDLLSYREHLSRQGLSSASVNRKMSSIKSLMTWFANQGFISHNPASNLKLPKVNVESPTLAFTDEEVVAMINAPDVKLSSGMTHRLILALLFHLGLRRSELVKLKRSDLMEDRGATVLRVHGKGDKVRIMPITEGLKNYFKEYFGRVRDWEPDDYLIRSSFEEPKKSMNPSTVFKIVRRYARQVGIDRRVSPHSCRATVISHLLENQVSPRDVADFVGHSSIQTTVGLYDKKRDGIKNSAALKVNYEDREESN